MSTAYREGIIAIHIPGKGYGLIKGDDGQKYHFRTSDMQDAGELSGYLRVSFETASTPRGPAAKNIRVIAECSEMWADPERFQITEQDSLRQGEILHVYSRPCWARATLHEQARQMLVDFARSQGANGIVHLRATALSGGLIHLEGVMVYAQKREPLSSPEALQASMQRVEQALQLAGLVDAEHERNLQANPLRNLTGWLRRCGAVLSGASPAAPLTTPSPANPPRSAGMIQSAYVEPLRRAGYYNQRMTRREFWSLTLINMMLLGLANGIPGLNLVATPVFLVVTTFAMCQRLNDAEISRWWLLMLAVPFVNILGLLWMPIHLCQPSCPTSNDHGPCRA